MKSNSNKKSSHSETTKSDEFNNSFEVLRFSQSKATNVVSFKESAFVFCSRQVGSVARVIKECRLFQPPPIISPTSIDAFSEENDPFGEHKRRFHHSISERCKILAELPDKEFKLFNHIWGNCSKESQEQIIRVRQQCLDAEGLPSFINHLSEPCEAGAQGARPSYEDWDTIQVSGDVLSLIRRINSSHLSPDDGSDAEKRYHTTKRHESLKMASTESLLDFKRRFDHSLEAYTAVGLTRPSEEILVFRFMDALEDSRFNPFKIERYNWSRTNPPISPLPLSLQKVYLAASTHRTASLSGPVGQERCVSGEVLQEDHPPRLFQGQSLLWW